MTDRYIDQRGIHRKIVSVEESSGPTMITFDCGHVSKFANHFHYVVGSETYCFKCGEEARAERKSLTNLDLISLSETSDR